MLANKLGLQGILVLVCKKKFNLWNKEEIIEYLFIRVLEPLRIV